VYLVNLDVSGPGGTNSKQVLLTVAPNSPPVAMPGGPYTATVGKPLLIDAGGSSDADGDPLTYSWVLSRSGSVIGRYNGSTLSMTLNKPGSYSVLLTVRDNRGGVSSSSTEINSYYTVPPPPPAPIPAPPVRSVAALAPAVVAAVPAPAPNARVSAASLPGGAAPAAVPPLWDSAAAAPVDAAGGYYQGAMQQQQPQGYGMQQLQPQQLAAGYQYAQQQQLQPQQQGLPAYQLPYQQQQQQLYPQQQQVQLPQQQQMMLQGQYALAGAIPTPQAYAQPHAMPQQPMGQPTAGATPQTMGMCLFKDGKPDYNPMNAAAFMQGRLTNAYWGPCPYNANTGSGAPPGMPVGPDVSAPAAAAAASPSPAPVSGNSVSAASAEAAEPVQSSAGIRSPEAFVKAEGAATQVR
jgi:PKD repeat protein